MNRIPALLAAGVLVASPAFAQLVEPNQVGLRMGHVHLVVKDVDAHKQFWVGIMGGTLVTNGPLELIQFPGVYIMLRRTEAALEPPAGAIVNHFGFIVKDMPAALAKWKAANLKIEPTENPNEVYLHAPDGIRLEVYGEPAAAHTGEHEPHSLQRPGHSGHQDVVREGVRRQPGPAPVHRLPVEAGHD